MIGFSRGLFRRRSVPSASTCCPGAMQSHPAEGYSSSNDERRES
jgi:hypothetical protein